MHEEQHFPSCRTAVSLKTPCSDRLSPVQTTVPCLQRGHSQTLLPSASCSFKRTVSAPARIEPAEPLRIYRHMLSISMNDFIAGSTAIRRPVASKAASIFSLTISLASRRALLPPRISFIILSANTPFASTASTIKGIEHPTPFNLPVTKVFRLA